MSDSFRAATGRKVVSRGSATQLGAVSHLVVAPDHRRVEAVVLGRGRKATIVPWAAVASFGVDAVMVDGDGAAGAPDGQRQQDAAAGRLELLDRRTLTDEGNEVGTVDDVLFDPATGTLEELVLAGGRRVAAQALRGAGSYAVVLHAGDLATA